MLEKDHPELSLKVQAELLGISYSSLFYKKVSPSARELAIKRRMDEIYTAHPYYGSRKIAVILHPELGVSRPTVQAICGKWAFLPLCQVHTPVNQLPNTRFIPICCEM